jgi:hypothetical protein
MFLGNKIKNSTLSFHYSGLAGEVPKESTFSAGIERDARKRTIFGPAGDLGFSLLEMSNKEIVPAEIRTREDNKNTNRDVLLGKKTTRSQTKVTKRLFQEN